MNDHIRLATAWYPVVTLGYGKRLGIWTQGCKKKCEGCISPEFQSFDGGCLYHVDEVFKLIPEGSEPDGMTISGGEPLDQPGSLLEIIRRYRASYEGDILVYTGYRLEELKVMDSIYIQEILKNIDVLIDGTYHPEYDDGKGLRGSSNQHIHLFHFKDRYEDAESCERKLQCVLYPNYSWYIGIPPR